MRMWKGKRWRWMGAERGGGGTVGKNGEER